MDIGFVGPKGFYCGDNRGNDPEATRPGDDYEPVYTEDGSWAGEWKQVDRRILAQKLKDVFDLAPPRAKAFFQPLRAGVLAELQDPNTDTPEVIQWVIEDAPIPEEFQEDVLPLKQAMLKILEQAQA